MAYICKFGRRKAAVAKCKIHPGEAHSVFVNGKEINSYFPAYFANKVLDAIKLMNLDTFRVEFFTKGGGLTGQSEACRLAVAKAVVENTPEIKPELKIHGWLTSDPRKVLSKRPGLKKARKAPQWVKR